MTSFNVKGILLSNCLAGALMALTQTAAATQLYFQGFETDISGWDAFSAPFHPTRVASGTNGITSASGSFHAESGGPTGAASNMGGYNFGAGSVPTAFQEYMTSVDIFLDLGGGWATDTRFDFSSAISGSNGSFLRDFVFNGGFYTAADSTAPGSGSDRFIFSASNNAGRGNSFPANPGRDPVAIAAGGWYTFEHHFYETGGFLAADLSITSAGGALAGSWTLGGAADPIATVGGNRYNWIVNNEFSTLAFDNSSLTVADVPEPGTFILFGLGLAGLGSSRRRKW